VSVDGFENRFVLLQGHRDSGDAEERMKKMTIENLIVRQLGDAIDEGLNILPVSTRGHPLCKIILILENLNNTNGLIELFSELFGAPWLGESWVVDLKNVNPSTCQIRKNTYPRTWCVRRTSRKSSVPVERRSWTEDDPQSDHPHSEAGVYQDHCSGPQRRVMLGTHTEHRHKGSKPAPVWDPTGRTDQFRTACGPSC
jgi:hypothetical protein